MENGITAYVIDAMLDYFAKDGLCQASFALAMHEDDETLFRLKFDGELVRIA